MVLQERRKMYKIRRDSCVLNYKDLCRFKKENIQHFLQDKNEIQDIHLKMKRLLFLFYFIYLFYLFILFIFCAMQVILVSRLVLHKMLLLPRVQFQKPVCCNYNKVQSRKLVHFLTTVTALQIECKKKVTRMVHTQFLKPLDLWIVQYTYT